MSLHCCWLIFRFGGCKRKLLTTTPSVCLRICFYISTGNYALFFPGDFSKWKTPRVGKVRGSACSLGGAGSDPHTPGQHPATAPREAQRAGGAESQAARNNGFVESGIALVKGDRFDTSGQVVIVSLVLSHKSGSWFEVSVQRVIAGLTISSGAGGFFFA